MTEKDRADLDFGLTLGIDWIALSFVQRASDIVEAQAIIQGRAGIVAKLEKPAAIECLDEILAETDAVMVARGDLGVEMPAEQVPAIQKRIVRACRKLGKPVIVATQMLESMVSAPVPTRAEASDVATAIYDGADAVMLSAESASGKFPVEAVAMMERHHRPDRGRSALPRRDRRIAHAAGGQHGRCHRLGRTFDRRAARRGGDGRLHQLGLVGAAHGARAAPRSDHRHDAQARDRRVGSRWSGVSIRSFATTSPTSTT